MSVIKNTELKKLDLDNEETEADSNIIQRQLKDILQGLLVRPRDLY